MSGCAKPSYSHFAMLVCEARLVTILAFTRVYKFLRLYTTCRFKQVYIPLKVVRDSASGFLARCLFFVVTKKRIFENSAPHSKTNNAVHPRGRPQPRAHFCITFPPSQHHNTHMFPSITLRCLGNRPH